MDCKKERERKKRERPGYILVMTYSTYICSERVGHNKRDRALYSLDTYARVKVNTLNPCFQREENLRDRNNKKERRTKNSIISKKEKKMNSNGRTPISISNIESSLEAMTRRLESSSSSGSKVRGNF